MPQPIASLTAILLNGPWSRAEMVGRLVRSVTPRMTRRRPIPLERWMRELTDRVLFHFPPERVVPLKRTLAAFLRNDVELQMRIDVLQVDDLIDARSEFRPLREEFRRWNLPELATTGELANWLKISVSNLEWLSGRIPAATSSQRYRLCMLHTRPGKARLLEIPGDHLKWLQRRILDELLSKVPVREAAHGFLPGHSVLTNAQVHVGATVIWKTDLSNFFLSVPARRVLGVFRMLGYPEHVARILTGLTTCRFSHSELEAFREKLPRDRWRELERLGGGQHLPTGAPTSPALANLVACQLDARQTGLAESFHAKYTRYADDLTFSGGDEFRRDLDRFRVRALAIIADEGFLIRGHKSVTATKSHRQLVTGLVVNSRVNAPREHYKLLHAILNNCVQRGPASQNREGIPNFAEHLRGRIAWIAHSNPQRGQKLHELYARINWNLDS